MILTVIDDFGKSLTPSLHNLSGTGGDIKRFLGLHIDCLIEYEDFYARLVKEQYMLPKEAQNTFICIQSGVSNHLQRAILKNNDLKLKDIPMYIIFNSWIGLLHYYLQNKEMFTVEGSVLKAHKEVLIDSFTKMICV